jgi:hypothetical protein
MLANGRSQPTVIARDKRGSGGSWGCVLLTNWLIAAETGPRRAAESGCHQKKGPSVFCCILLPPTFHREPRQRGTGSPSPNVLRPTDYLISKGGECMLTNLLYRAASKFRFHAPSTVTTLAYMAYRARGAEQASDRPLSVASKSPGNCGPQSRKRPVDDPRVG